MEDAPLEVTKAENKTPMTDEERVALCQKLDQDLDDFINSMERKKYTDGWSEDTWEVIFLPSFSAAASLSDTSVPDPNTQYIVEST